MNTILQQELLQWIKNKVDGQELELVPLQGDASLRTFYRLNTIPPTILIDAKQDLKNQEFFNVSQLLQLHHIKAPKIFSHDINLGLFQVEDFGDIQLFNQSDQTIVEDLLKQAVDVIIKIQTIPTQQLINPISFDAAFIERELNLFNEWFITQYLELSLSNEQKQVIDEAFVLIKEVLLSQPYVCMHRDFHSKNIMILPDQSLGILDFQDLMLGPVTYDLISLLRDCYITWPSDVIENLLSYYYQAIGKRLNFKNFTDFIFYVDIAGLQRHLKVLGGFSKIYLTRNNGSYLQYFDRIVDYIVQVIAKYPEFNEFYRVFTLVIIRKLFS